MAENSHSPGSERPFFTLLSDHPVESEAGKCVDLFDLHESLRVHLDTLRHRNTRTPFSIALYGDWGTGKTSAMRWLENQIRIWNDSEARKKLNQEADAKKNPYPHLTPVWFYPWKYHTREDVWRGIISEVILATLKSGSSTPADFSKRAVHVAKRYGKFLGHSFLHVLANTKIKGDAKASLGAPGVAGSEMSGGVELDGQAIRDIYDEYRKASEPHAPFLNDFEEEMKHWVEQTFDDKERRLVLFIDDLDRCLPEVALEVLEALKLYLNIPGLLFVAGLDDHVISQVIINRYGKHGVEEHKARQYLAKIFQVEYRMEPSEAKASGFLEKRIAALNHLTDGEWGRCLPVPKDPFAENPPIVERYRPAVEKALRELGSSNPREFTRLLNSLLVRAVAARSMGGDKDQAAAERRFVQGAQIFLIERFLLRQLNLGFSRRNPLLATNFCSWLEELSELRIGDPELELPDSIYEPESAGLDQGIAMAIRNDPDFMRLRELAEKVPHVRDAHRILREHAWDLLLIPFDASIAAATVSSQSLPPPVEVSKASNKDADYIAPFTQALEEYEDRYGPYNPEAVDLRSQKISDLAGLLKRHTEIRMLDLRGSIVHDLGTLEELTSLEWLNLSSPWVNDILSLRKLVNLRHLYLRGTKVDDLTTLEGMSQLETLELLLSPVSNIAPLAKLKNLRSLDLRYTNVGDFNPLHELKDSLVELRIIGTPGARDSAMMASLRKALPNTMISGAFPS